MTHPPDVPKQLHEARQGEVAESSDVEARRERGELGYARVRLPGDGEGDERRRPAPRWACSTLGTSFATRARLDGASIRTEHLKAAVGAQTEPGGARGA